MFGDRLQLLRLSNRLTQVQLAARLGVSKQSISNWEKGNMRPSVDMLEKIADLFGVQTDYLLGRSEAAYLNIDGLNPDQLAHVKNLISYLQKLNAAMDALLQK